MTSCPDILSRLDAWLDNELPAVVREEVEHHLAVCHECRAQFQRAETLINDLSVLGDVAGRMAANQPIVTVTRSLRPWRIAAAILFGVGMGFSSLVAWRNLKSPDPQPIIVADAGPTQPSLVHPTIPEAASVFEVTDTQPELVLPIASRNPNVQIVWFYQPLSPSGDTPESQPLSTTNPDS